MTTKTAILSALLGLLAAAPAAAADLEVRLEGLRSADGMVRAALFRDDGRFPDGDAVAGATVSPAAPGTLRIVFADLPPGDYAVAAYHDADGDGELDRTLLGLPTEGHGFSNDARGFMGPPGFAAAAVTVGAGEGRVLAPVSLAYPDQRR